jgi:hypothetical protein
MNSTTDQMSLSSLMVRPGLRSLEDMTIGLILEQLPGHRNLGLVAAIIYRKLQTNRKFTLN